MFRRKPLVPVCDKVWKTAELRLAGICEEVRRTATVVLAIAHFEQSAQALKRALEELGLRCRELTGPVGPVQVTPEPDQDGTRVFLALSDQLVLPSRPETAAPRHPSSVPIVVMERHPLRAIDDAVVAFAGCLPYQSAVTFHVALDDPLLRLFVGPSIGPILGRLGWNDAEPIESEPVSRAIAAAQARVKGEARSNERVASAEEWIRYNLRNS